MFIRRFGPLFAAVMLALPAAVAAPGFQDVLDTPAQPSLLAAKALLNGLAAAGQRLVAVGQRGHIVYSDDAGQSWKQAKVPVSSDLVAVSFPTPQQGWAVGHDGVVLHSTDAGATWNKQLDGRSAGEAMLAYYTTQGAEESAKLLDEAKRIAAQGAENPFLDVWFADEHTGYVVGAFNLILRTGDGGKTWEPWFHRTANPGRLHLYAVRGVGADVYAVGEQGLVLKLDRGAGRFEAVQTPYKGTYFGVAGSGDAVVVFGLRGNAYRSSDGGRNWHKVETGVQDGLTGAATLGERGLVLVSQSGQVLVSRDGGERFAALKIDRTTPASAVLSAGQDAVVIAGPRGVRTQALR